MHFERNPTYFSFPFHLHLFALVSFCLVLIFMSRQVMPDFILCHLPVFLFTFWLVWNGSCLSEEVATNFFPSRDRRERNLFIPFATHHYTHRCFPPFSTAILENLREEKEGRWWGKRIRNKWGRNLLQKVYFLHSFYSSFSLFERTHILSVGSRSLTIIPFLSFCLSSSRPLFFPSSPDDHTLFLEYSFHSSWWWWWCE